MTSSASEQPLTPTGEAASAPLVDTPREALSVQHLRAAAAILVVTAHAQDQFPGIRQLFPSTAGLGGVDIFFVISGFVMTYTTGLRHYTGWEFLKRRLARIAPLYWVMTLFTAALLLAAPALVRDSKFAWSDLAASLAFFPHYNAAKSDSIRPMLKLGWTLNYEMFFYLLFTITIVLKPLKRTLAIGAFFVALVGFVAVTQPTAAPLAFWGDPIVFEFIFGCLIGCLDLRGLTQRIPAAAAFAVLAVGVAGFVFMDGLAINRVFARGVPALLMVLSALALERTGAVTFGRRLIHFLGNASYSIYLSHLYSVIFFRIVWEKLHLPTETLPWALTFVALCVATGIGGGCVTYLLVEKPLGRLIRKPVAI